jgi:hypothetical protein
MKILPVGVEFSHSDRQAGVKLPADFSHFFATEPKNSLKIPHIAVGHIKGFMGPICPAGLRSKPDSFRAL